MLKVKKERTDPAFMSQVLAEADDCVLALVGPEGPYAVPVNFVHLNGKLYVHCAPEGHKLDLLRADPRVAFTAAVGVKILREKSSTAYRSVCGKGIAVIVDDTEEKRDALDAIARRFRANCPTPTPDSALRRTAVIRIDITALTGKCSEGPVE